MQGLTCLRHAEPLQRTLSLVIAYRNVVRESGAQVRDPLEPAASDTLVFKFKRMLAKRVICVINVSYREE